MKTLFGRLLVLGALVLCQSQLNAQANDSNAKQLICKAYKDHWGIDVPHPYYVRGKLAFYEGDNYIMKDDGWMAKIWDLKAKATRNVYLQTDGKINFAEDKISVPPKGNIRVALFITDNGKTNFTKKFSTWDANIDAINQSWTKFAKSQGSDKPFAVLKTVKFVDSASALPRVNSAKESTALIDYLKSKGYSTSDFEILAWINLDASEPGHCGGGNYKVSIHHFMGKATGFYNYTDQQIYYIAYATFVHEMGHCFTWDHGDTETSFKDDYMIIDPGFYGWRDTDGDGVVELLDSTPYGIGGGNVTIPTAPSSLKSSNVTNNSASLSWADNSNNESGFKIERKIGSKWTEIAKVGANIKSYKNTGLTASKDYSYRVRAYNSKGNSSYSNTINITTKK